MFLKKYFISFAGEAGKKRLRSNLYSVVSISNPRLPERMTEMPTRNAETETKKNTLRLTPRFWLLLFLTFIIVFTPLYIISNRRSAQLKAQEAELLAQKQALSERVLSLKSDLEYARSDAGIEQYARAEGMIMPGEIKYSTASGTDK